MTAPPTTDTAQLARLSRIEGQLRGVSAMIAGGRYCLEISGQIEAVIGALRRVKSELVSDFVRACARESQRRGNPAPMEQCVSELFDDSAAAERPPVATSDEPGPGHGESRSQRRRRANRSERSLLT